MNQIVYTRELKEESDEKKLFNINSFSQISRDGLSYGTLERRLFIEEYDTGEKLFIQYPGKESIQRGNRAIRPWDFRPKLQLSNASWLSDLSFKDIWDDLYSLKNLNIDMSFVATLYFRMAYMIDTELITKNLNYQDLDNNGDVVSSGTLELTWYAYHLDRNILNEINIPTEALRGCNLLPYLAYNDYLAQNEDCKYYYRAVYDRNENWNKNTGRRNTLLTHMAIIAFIEEKLKFTEITDMFQRGMGVAVLPTRYWEDTTHGKVIKR